MSRHIYHISHSFAFFSFSFALSLPFNITHFHVTLAHNTNYTYRKWTFFCTIDICMSDAGQDIVVMRDYPSACYCTTISSRWLNTVCIHHFIREIFTRKISHFICMLRSLSILLEYSIVQKVTIIISAQVKWTLNFQIYSN